MSEAKKQGLSESERKIAAAVEAVFVDLLTNQLSAVAAQVSKTYAAEIAELRQRISVLEQPVPTEMKIAEPYGLSGPALVRKRMLADLDRQFGVRYTDPVTLYARERVTVDQNGEETDREIVFSAGRDGSSPQYTVALAAVRAEQKRRALS